MHLRRLTVRALSTLVLAAGTASALAAGTASASAAVPAPVLVAGPYGQGVGTSQYLHPLDLVTDAHGGLYVVDGPSGYQASSSPGAYVSLLRSVAPDGTVRNLAAGAPACADVFSPHAPAAGRTCPATVSGAAVGADGTVYVADARLRRVYRWDGGDSFTPVLGSGGYGAVQDGPALGVPIALGTDAAGGPDSLAVDGRGRLLVATQDAVMRVDRGVATRVLGADPGGCCGGAAPADGAQGRGVRVLRPDLSTTPDGQVLVTIDAAVWRLDADDVLHPVTSRTGDPLVASSVSVDRDGSVLAGAATSDGRSYVVRRLDAATGTVLVVAGGGADLAGAGAPSSSRLLDSAVAATPSGMVVAQRDHGSGQGPVGLLLRLSPGGATLEALAGRTSSSFAQEGVQALDASFSWGLQVRAVRDGSLYALDPGADRVRRIATDGTVTTVAGGAAVDPYPLTDGMPAAQLSLLPTRPRGGATAFAVADDSTVYLAFADSRQVWAVDPVTARVRVVAGSGAAPGPPGAGDGGPARSAPLGHPDQLAVTRGDLLVVDQGVLRAVDRRTGSIRTWPTPGPGVRFVLTDQHDQVWTADLPSSYARRSECPTGAALLLTPRAATARDLQPTAIGPGGQVLASGGFDGGFRTSWTSSTRVTPAGINPPFSRRDGEALFLDRTYALPRIMAVPVGTGDDVASLGPCGSDVRFVRNVYRDLFDRDPDLAGLDGWVRALAAGAPRGVVADAITASDESRTALIRDAYAHYLHREPDQAGLAAWLRAMRAGLTIEQLQAGFVASEEYYAGTRSEGDPYNWVASMYRDVLGREPSMAEPPYWTARMREGMTRSQVALGFLLSDEHLGAVVDARYRVLLRRGLDPAGRRTWGRAIQGGARDEQVVAAITSSAEYAGI